MCPGPKSMKSEVTHEFRSESREMPTVVSCGFEEYEARRSCPENQLPTRRGLG